MLQATETSEFQIASIIELQKCNIKEQRILKNRVRQPCLRVTSFTPHAPPPPLVKLGGNKAELFFIQNKKQKNMAVYSGWGEDANDYSRAAARKRLS